ncbi:MAG: hypothetical protein ACR2OC_02520 [Solirubrobacterales bacterium]
MLRLVAHACIALAGLLPIAGCGDDEGDATTTTTSDTGTSGTTGASGAEAEDAQAKSDVKAGQAALETYAVDHNGSYEGADPTAATRMESGDV